MKCGNCNYRYIVHPKYGNMDNCKFTICCFRPNLKQHPNSEPKWCPIKKDKEQK